ncbi:DUF1800 family protein [Larkinella insperata]|uniref:DUF1800 family protein n=1 Tax=Larkinella insperata TaxID=332158 RepID=A0ABW3PZY3_9BACT|nr:DUF1800 domain-containing protein [Larkinella insperata]
MAYLDTYTVSLSAQAAAHLLRRTTFGPTQHEIADFTGLTASQAFDRLLNNAAYRAAPSPPVELEEGRPDSGQPFLTKPYDASRAFTYYSYIQYWWIGLMTEQNGHPSLLEKLTAFWQNHFVTAHREVVDYRCTDRYLGFLRANALGNFRELVVGITKDPAMLIFQNGNDNTKEHPNENYGRELQELFTVGQKNFAGQPNYTEQDVKSAAQVLTGWQVTNFMKAGSTSVGAVFNPARHDPDPKLFSAHYNYTTIAGRSDPSAGEAELADLVNMLLSHPETPRFICRKLYRWYVNPNVTQEIEDQVIRPLAVFFASSENNYAIAPVLRKLLTSQLFFEARNVGAIVKSPAEFVIGAVRLFNQPVPDSATEYGPFRNMMGFLSNSMASLQLNFLNQPTVFGSLPYFQTGFSKNWINGSTLGLRANATDTLVYPYVQIKPGYTLGIDVLNRLTNLQPNFTDVSGTPAITSEQVLADFSRHLFATELTSAQQNFLIDSIMMMNSSPRTTWIREWNAYRAEPADGARQNVVLWRCRTLLKYMLRMAEYQVF